MASIRFPMVILALVLALAPGLVWAGPATAEGVQATVSAEAPAMTRQQANNALCTVRCQNRYSNCTSRCRTGDCSSRCGTRYQTCLLGCRR